MRLAVLCHRLDRTGAPIILFRLVRRLVERHDVSLLLPRYPGPLLEEYRAIGVTPCVGIAPDEVDLFLCNTLMTGKRVKDIAGRAPVVYWVHEPAGGLDMIRDGRSDPAAFDLATRVVFPTLWQARTLFRPYLTRDNWDVVPYGIDTDTTPLPAPFQRQPGQVYLFHSGILQPRKGQDITVIALERLADPRIEVFMAGCQDTDPDFVARLKAYLAARPDLERRVHLLGSLSETQVNAYLQHCDAVVFPTRDDLITLAILEAMLFGKCVISSDYGPIPETIDHMSTGLLSAVNDPDGLAANIALAASDPGLRQRLGQQGRQRYEEKHAFAAHLAGMERVLENTLATWRARSA